MANGKGKDGLINSSTSSICILIPPLLIILSFLPRTTKLPSVLNLMISLVIKTSSQTKGACITNVSSVERESRTEEKGTYDEEAKGPFKRRKAMCESVSVIP